MSRKPVYIFFLLLYLAVGAGAVAYSYLQGDLSLSTYQSELMNLFNSLF